MPTPAPRRHARLATAFLAILCAMALTAPAANAGLSLWTSLPGLTGTPSWVRTFTAGTPQTTIFAGTEGDGVWRSLNAGASWSQMGTLPSNARDVFTLYVSGGKVYAGTDLGIFSAPVGGTTWTPLAQGPEENPANPSNLNVSVQTMISIGSTWLAGTVSEGVFRSSDSGNTWLSPLDDNGMPPGTTVWGLSNFANFVWAATSDGIYRSADAGVTWALASDGIPANAITLNVFPDNKVPTIYYATTGGDGLYRTLNGGVTWQPVDFDDFPGNATIRDVREFSGDKETRLYVATTKGVWVGTVPNVGAVASPLEATWRHLTDGGLGSNTITWGLQNFLSTPGVFLLGTQSNGGYSITIEPPHNSGNSSDLPSWIGAPAITANVGQALLGTAGTWTGTLDIDYEFQWQRCGTTAASCQDIDGATSNLYTFTSADLGHHFRLKVTATNDAPEAVKTLHVAYSDLSTGTVQGELGPLPGDNQQQAPAISLSPGASQPIEGDTLSALPSPGGGASGWYFSPAATLSVSYQWLRCDSNGDNCEPIEGATHSTYKLTSADAAHRIRVIVKGVGDHGAATLQPSGPSSPIIPLPATNLVAPSLLGKQFVGATLTGAVGTWKSPATTYERHWERCEADGSDCSPIFGATDPGYTLTAADYGMTVRMRVTADVNLSYELPYAVDAYTPLSAVIQYPPGVTPPPPPPGPGPDPNPNPLPKLPVPKVSSFKLVKSSTGAKLAFKLSGVGSVRVQLQRASAGHKAKGKCYAGSRHHATRCTYYATVLSLSAKSLGAGAHTLSLPTKVHGRPLKSGIYRAVITPLDAAGKKGTPHTISLTLRR